MLTELLAVGSNQAEKRDLFASFYDQKKSKLTTGNSWTFTLTRNFGCRKVNLAYPPKGPVFFMEFTVKLTKPWTPEIFMECYCVARNKPIRRKITKPQTATVISLWFRGLLTCPELYCDWPVHNQHSWNFSGVHGFLSLTVINCCLKIFYSFDLLLRPSLFAQTEIKKKAKKKRKVESERV